jgi:ADP-ribose pyrophosphatase YjhB (NUDIX family)
VDYVGELRALVGHRPLVLAVAGALVFYDDGPLLLHKHTLNGLWRTSGGPVQPGESLEETARRQLRDETGVDGGRLRLLDVYSGAEFFVEYANGDQAYVVGALFIAEDVRGDELATGAVDYFAFDALPDDIDPYHLRLLERSRRLIDAAALGR